MIKILLIATSFLAVTPCLGQEAQEARLFQLTEGAGDHRYPVWSPENDFLVFESNRDGNWELYLLRVEDKTIARITDHPADDRYPMWDPLGRRILFQSTRTGTAELHILDLQTKDVQLLARIEGEEAFPDWSPDGEKIAFSMEVEGVSQIVILDKTGNTQMVAPSAFSSAWPRWSPDGNSLAFSSRRDTDGSDDEIYLLNPKSATMRRLTDRMGDDFCPAWSPDGTRLVSVGTDADGSRSLRLISVSGDATQVLRTNFYRLTEPDWSPDGKFVVVSGRQSATESYHLFVIPIDR